MTFIVRAPQLGSNTVITCTVVMGGELYGGTNTGALLKWDGVSAWTEVATPHAPTTYVSSMVVYGGVIYAMVGTPADYALDLVSFNGSAWVDELVTSTQLAKVLVNFSGGLYGVGGADDGSGDGVCRYKPVLATLVASPVVGASAMCAVEFGALIWACFTDGIVRTNNGVATSFTTQATLTGEYGTSIATHAGELYIGTSIGKLYKWNGSSFALQATAASGYPITSLVSFNSKLYAGLSLP